MNITVKIFYVISLCAILEKKPDSEREQETIVPEEDLFMRTFVLVKLLASTCFYATCVFCQISVLGTMCLFYAYFLLF